MSTARVLKVLWPQLLVCVLMSVGFMAMYSCISEAFLAQACKEGGLDPSTHECRDSDHARSVAAARLTGFQLVPAIGNVLVVNLIGQIAQCKGRKIAMLLTFAGSTVSALGLGILGSAGSSFALLLVVGGVSSLMGGLLSSIAAIYAMGADLFHDEPTEINVIVFGMLEAALWIGYVTGPFVGHVIAEATSFKVLFLADAALFGAITVGVALGFTETLRKKSPINPVRVNPAFGFWFLLRNAYTAKLSIVVGLSLLATLGPFLIYPLYFGSRFSLSENAVGLFQSTIFLGGSLGLAFLLPWFTKRGMSSRGIILTAIMCACVSIGSVPFLTESWMIYLCAAAMCCNGMQFPVVRANLTDYFGPDQRGATLASLASFECLAALVNPLIFPGIYAITQNTKPSGLVFLISAGILIVSAFVALVLPTQPPAGWVAPGATRDGYGQLEEQDVLEEKVPVKLGQSAEGGGVDAPLVGDRAERDRAGVAGVGSIGNLGSVNTTAEA